MLFDYKRYQLNSMRLGLITKDKMYNRTTIFFNCASQADDASKIEKYNQLYNSGRYNFIVIPFDLDGKEYGDNHDIYQYYENVLKVEFAVLEKMEPDHLFFQDFGKPDNNFTNYMFDTKLNFVEKTTAIEELIDV